MPEALPFLCFLLDLPRPPAAAHLDGLSPEELHRRALRAIGKLHRRLAAERPCIIAVDDLHWAGPTILALHGVRRRADGRGAAAAGAQLPRRRRRAVLGAPRARPPRGRRPVRRACAGAAGAPGHPGAGPGAARRGRAGRPGRRAAALADRRQPALRLRADPVAGGPGRAGAGGGHGPARRGGGPAGPGDAPGDDPGAHRPAARGGAAGGPDRRGARSDVLAPALDAGLRRRAGAGAWAEGGGPGAASCSSGRIRPGRASVSRRGWCRRSPSGRC